MTPGRAMVLGAGLGKRMRPLTLTRPKPLIPVAGQALLDRALDRLAAVGVGQAVVNTHYLAEQIAAHLAGRQAPRISLRHEKTLLDTGGGVANALDELGTDPFYVVNSDALWQDRAVPALVRLADTWQDDMDALLLLVAREDAIGHGGAGDYERDGSGRLRRRRGDHATYVFAGVQILHPRLFAGARIEPFSLRLLYDKAEEAGRLFGLVHDGDWYHVGTPESLELAERRLAAGRQ